MIRTKNTYIAFITFVAMISCKDDIAPLSTHSVPADLSATIGSYTRAYNATWEVNDQIGVFVTQGANPYLEHSNYPYETSSGDGIFTPMTGREPIFFPGDGSSVDFTAYYPYIGNATTNSLNITNWNDHSKNFDMLISDKKSGNMDSPSVALTFSHLFSRLVLNITADNENSQLQQSDLEGIEVRASNMNVNVTVVLATGKVTQDAAVPEDIIFTTNSQGTESFAIIPPNYNTQSSDRRLKFVLSNGDVFVWSIPSGTKFESGNSYTYRIKLKGEGLVEATLIATINDWSENVQGDIELELNN